MIIGICGKSGSGKSTLSNKLIDSYENATFLDIDKIGHKVLTIDEVKKEIEMQFGTHVIKDTKVDRKKLGEMVFNSRLEMQKLTDITWKWMQIEIDNFLNLNKDKIVILDWILLPLSKYYDMCDLKILLDVPYEVRKKRAMKRDNITSKDFDLRERASVDFNEADFDYVIQDCDEEFVKRLVKKYE